jgi:hypothetical protein
MFHTESTGTLEGLIQQSSERLSVEPAPLRLRIGGE